MQARAFIVGLAGAQLGADERAFLRDAEPWGLILFTRNIRTPEQVRALIGEFRETLGRTDAPVLVDQEGGRVQRLGPPHWPRYPAGSSYLATTGNVDAAAKLVRLTAQLIARDLHAAGVNVDCLPVLDV